MRKAPIPTFASRKRQQNPRKHLSHQSDHYHQRGVSECIGFIRACLDSKGDAFFRREALAGLADLLGIVLGEALRGEKLSGFFLGELAPVLVKKRGPLTEANETFKKRIEKIESSRPQTKRSSALRSLIHEIIGRALGEIRSLEVLYTHITHPRLRAQLLKSFKMNERLAAFPPLDPSFEVITKWTDEIVYPALRRMTQKGELPREILNMKKAMDENGKFQLSNLRSQIQDTVVRESKLPHLYYFDF